MSDAHDFIEVYPNALPTDLCDRLIETHSRHAGVYQGRTGAGVDLAKKNSKDLMLDDHPELSELRSELMNHTFTGLKRYFETYYMALCGAVSVDIQMQDGKSQTLTAENFDLLGKEKVGDILGYMYRSGSINVQMYEAGSGGYPHWHSEHYPQTGSTVSLHRVLLYMYYLNDVVDGGETEFYYQRRKISPVKGTLVIAPAYFTHTHRGNVPVSNDKYIATSWVMFNEAKRLYG